MECWFLLQSLSFLHRPLFTCHWGPSCWSPSQKPATPPWAGRTVTTHSKRSYRGGREARERRIHREHHGVPSLRHDRLCRKLVDQVHLLDRVHLVLLWVLSLWVLCPLCHPGHLWVLCDPVTQVDPSDRAVLVIRCVRGNHSLRRGLEVQVGRGDRAAQRCLTQACSG